MTARNRFRVRCWGVWRRLFIRWLTVPGCAESILCRKSMRHGKCVDCGRLTCSTTTRIQPQSLRRQRMACCHKCSYGDETPHLRRRRTMHDWGRALPDQFPGVTRRIIHEFLDSEESERLITRGDESHASSLNQSLSSLGLADDAYAEIRGHDVWLRRLHDGAVEVSA